MWGGLPRLMTPGRNWRSSRDYIQSRAAASCLSGSRPGCVRGAAPGPGGGFLQSMGRGRDSGATPARDLIPAGAKPKDSHWDCCDEFGALQC
jgi:hypothetical protein